MYRRSKLLRLIQQKRSSNSAPGHVDKLPFTHARRAWPDTNLYATQFIYYYSLGPVWRDYQTFTLYATFVCVGRECPAGLASTKELRESGQHERVQVHGDP
jgi:hypothetical protein